MTDTLETVVAWANEALELRHDKTLDIDFLKNDYTEVLTMLEAVRVRADRVEELLSKATQARARARRIEAAAKFKAESRYFENAVNSANKRADFSSGRERDAEAKLNSFEELRAAHQAANFVSVTQEVYDLIYQASNQLNGYRNDLRSVLRTLQFESTLEH